MRDLTKRSNTFLWANKAEAGTREKIAEIGRAHV